LPATGPDSEKFFVFAAVAQIDAVWAFFCRFDSEPWVLIGYARSGWLQYSVTPDGFFGPRLTAGNHTVFLQARDSDDVSSNIIGVSYRIAGGIGGAIVAGIVIGALGGVAVLAGIVWSCLRAKREEPEGEASVSVVALTDTLGFGDDGGEFRGGNQFVA
jgi:hypothetical protein